MDVLARLSLIALLTSPVVFSLEAAQTRTATAEVAAVETVLWRATDDISSADLFYGSGGPERQPAHTLTFVEEDLEGTNPKFIVRDETGVKWKVKLGDEARPETAASRFVWAMGYFTADEYFVPTLNVRDLPARLHRGQKFVEPDGTLQGARLKREPDGLRKIGIWKWRENPFTGAREWNGLRVLMALMNNWDLKDVNNAVWEEELGEGRTRRIYQVSDLGATFGDTKLSLGRHRTKGDLNVYRRTQFVRKIADDYIDFEAPARPTFVWMVDPPQYFKRFGIEWIGRRIPRQDARWMGEQLAQLSDSQIRNAFRAAGYSEDEIDGFTALVKERIALLTQL